VTAYFIVDVVFASDFHFNQIIHYRSHRKVGQVVKSDAGTMATIRYCCD